MTSRHPQQSSRGPAFTIRTLGLPAALAASCIALAACGGGNSADTTPAAKITSVKVFGDSLADSGTYGYKFTVQTADNFIFPERIAQAYGQTLCNYYAATGANSFVLNPKAGCTDYAIGSGRINFYTNPADPRGVTVQLAAAGAAGFSATDLALIDGGGNDAADLVGAYLAAAQGGVANYSALLKTLLPAAQVDGALATGAAGFAGIGVPYMQALADKMHAAIKANALDKGAQYVAILNMPGITNTPQFQMVLDGIGAAQGATARAQSEALFKSWIEAFNTQLAAKFAGESRVAVIDFYTAFNEQIATPAQFGLTNVKTPACPIKGVGSNGLPTYDFPTCTGTALSAAPPTGATGADWWKSYAFADSFHPTPYGHQLTAQLISKTLATKGWL